MTKGFLALAVPVVGVLPWVIAQKRWREVLTYGWLAVGVCILTVLPWGWLSPNANRTSGAISSGWSIFNALPKRCPAQGAVLVLHPVPARRKPAVAGAAARALKRGWSERDDVRGALYLLGWVAMPFLFSASPKGNYRPTFCRASGRYRF